MTSPQFEFEISARKQRKSLEPVIFFRYQYIFNPLNLKRLKNNIDHDESSFFVVTLVQRSCLKKDPCVRPKKCRGCSVVVLDGPRFL